MIINKTDQTPEVIFDVNSNLISIHGICVPENSKEFFTKTYPILEEYKKLTKKVTLDIFLDYFNTSAAKEILTLLMKINNQKEHFSEPKFVWRYRKEDDDMLECGEVFEDILGVKFEFIEMQRE